MDDVNALFDFSSNSTFKRTVVSGGYTSGRMVIDPNLFPEKVNRKTEGTEYAAKYQKAEQEQLSKVLNIFNLIWVQYSYVKLFPTCIGVP